LMVAVLFVLICFAFILFYLFLCGRCARYWNPRSLFLPAVEPPRRQHRGRTYDRQDHAEIGHEYFVVPAVVALMGCRKSLVDFGIMLSTTR
jgi:hypothetical protein